MSANTYADTREQYQERFQAAQAEVGDFLENGLNSEGKKLLQNLPPIAEIEDQRIKACVAIPGDIYNHTLVAIANAVGRRAKTRKEVDAFCGLWSVHCAHPPYQSNIRKLLLGPTWHRIVGRDNNLTLGDLSRAIHWFYYQVKAAMVAEVSSIACHD